jgi:hypothetical protein
MYIILCDVGVFLTNINELRESKKKKINSLSYLIDLFNILSCNLINLYIQSNLVFVNLDAV